RFRRDQPHRPPRLPGGRGAAHQGDDALALTLLQQPLMARTRLLFERLLQTLFLPAPGNGPHRLGGDRQIPRHLRRRLPPGPVWAEARPAAARAPTPVLCSASRRSASDPSSTVGHLPDGKVSCPNHAPDSYPKPVPNNIPLHVVRDLESRLLARIRLRTVKAAAMQKGHRRVRDISEISDPRNS